MARFRLLPVAFLLLPACAGQSIIPLDIEKQVDHTLSFAQVKEAPTTHVGKVLVLGGEILNATRLKEHTRLTVLQLPTGRNQAPTMDRTMSRGRFLAFQTEFLDPATVPSGTRITIVGKVSGATTELLDEMDYTYPTVNILFIKVWPEGMQLPPRFGRYGYPYPYWYAGGPYWGPYWGPYGVWGPYWGAWGRPFRFAYW